MRAGYLFYPECRYPELYPFLKEKQEDTQRDTILKQWIRLSLEEIEMNRDAGQNEFLVYQKRNELLTGGYGERVQIYCRELEKEQLGWIANALCLQEMGESITLYGKVLINFTGTGSLYQNMHKKEELLFYVGREPDRGVAQGIELINILFLPWGYGVKIYWKEAFAVLGADCSVLGYIQL